MTKQEIIEQTLKAIQQLPENEASKVCAFALELMSQHSENQVSEEAGVWYAQKKGLAFLADEEDLYSEADLKELYHAKG